MADTQDSGSCPSNWVEVQVLSGAPVTGGLLSPPGGKKVWRFGGAVSGRVALPCDRATDAGIFGNNLVGNNSGAGARRVEGKPHAKSAKGRLLSLLGGKEAWRFGGSVLGRAAVLSRRSTRAGSAYCSVMFRVVPWLPPGTSRAVGISRGGAETRREGRFRCWEGRSFGDLKAPPREGRASARPLICSLAHLHISLVPRSSQEWNWAIEPISKLVIENSKIIQF